MFVRPTPAPQIAPTTPGSARALVLFEGDLPSVLALSYAAEEASQPARAGGRRESRPGLSRATAEAHDQSGHLGTDLAGSAPLVLAAFAGLPDARQRESALARATDLLGAERVSGDLPDLTSGATSPGEEQTRRLIQASYLAVSLGCDRVVWPVQFGEDLRAASPSLDRVAAAIDRALLVSRLVGLDIDHRFADFEVQTPFVDLSDRQIAEMVMDIEAPLSACWWWGSPLAAAMACRDRWGTLLRSLGWGGALTPEE